MNYTFGSITYDLDSRAHLMGILNVTPDSFSDGGKYLEPERAVEHALRMVEEGADIIDVGGESSRPGSEPVPADVEISRVVPVIGSLAAATDIPISVDTTKPEVAEAALGAGATIVNDISGLASDGPMADVIAARGGSVVIMHMKGTPATMQIQPMYDDLIGEINDFLRRAVMKAERAGIRQIVVDPGIGFGKTAGDNIEILGRIGAFRELGYPVMVGPSRKSFLGALLSRPVDQRLEGTLAAVTAAVINGAAIVRVHDVAPVKRFLTVLDAVRRSAPSVSA